MSSTKKPATRQLISHWGVVVVALAVLAAGCSQSEDGASDGSEPAASSSPAGLSSAAPPAAESTTTTQASVEEEPPDSGSEIASTTTSLPDSGAGSALSGRVAELVEVGIDACVDLYELRCARALWDACMQVRIELGSILRLRIDISTSEIVEIDDLRDDICSLFQMVQYWELHSILTAKYGENFYRSDTGFLSFRNAESSIPNSLILPQNVDLFPAEFEAEFFENSYETFEDFEKRTRLGRYFSDDLRLELVRFAFDMATIHLDLISSIVPLSEDMANRILGVYDALQIDDECLTPLLDDIFLSYKNGIFTTARSWNNVESKLTFECIIDMCRNGYEKFFIGCYQCSEEYEMFFGDCNLNWPPAGTVPSLYIAIPNNGRVFQYTYGLSYSMRLLFWEVLKYSCATGEIYGDAYADDACRTVAYNICRIVEPDAFGDKSFFEIESAICDLSKALERLPYENAKDECLHELETFLTNENLFSARDGRCNNATQRCLEFRGEFAYTVCGGFEKYFHIETFWKNIPAQCSQNNSNFQATIFDDSECYDSVNIFCGNELNSSLLSNENRFKMNDEFSNEDIPFRERKMISIALCNALLRNYNTIDNISMSRNLNLLPSELQENLLPILVEFLDVEFLDPVTIDVEQTSTELTSDNFDLVSTARAVCAASLPVLGNSECAIALWKSCFNLFYSRAKHESNESEVYRSSQYVCTATWIAELARMASALLSSFPEDYQAGRFYQFLRYITAEAVDGDEGILAIDESGTARPNLNREGLSPEVAESLTALGNSIAQLVQPYLNLATTNTQVNI